MTSTSTVPRSHVTYGDFVFGARRRVNRAITALTNRPRLDGSEAAYEVLTLRRHLLASTADAARVAIGQTRLSALRAHDDPRRARSEPAGQRAAITALLEWVDTLDAHARSWMNDPAALAVRDDARVGQSTWASQPARDLHGALVQLRAGTDLLLTHLTPEGTLRSIGDPRVGQASPAESVAILARMTATLASAEPFALTARASGLSRAVVDQLAPVSSPITDASVRFLQAIGHASTLLAADVRLAQTGIRHHSPGEQWADRLTRIRQRVSAHERVGNLSVRTASDVARLALATTQLLHRNGSAAADADEIHAWRTLRRDLAGLHSTLPADPVIRHEAGELLDLASLVTTTDTPAFINAVEQSLPTLAVAVSSVERQLAVNQDIWTPAPRKIPRYLHRTPGSPNHQAHRATAPHPWPTVRTRAATGLALTG